MNQETYPRNKTKPLKGNYFKTYQI